jgi:fumarate reductase flavoprotein subunit
VEVINNPDTPTISDIAINTVTSDIIKYQSIDVDTVSGATLTSTGLLVAVKTALEQAGDLSIFETIPDYPAPSPAEDCEVDVIIVGGGTAGMNAAIEVINAGKSVVLIEKQDFLGGGDCMFASSSFMAGGGFNVYRDGLEDYTEEDFCNYMLQRFSKLNLDEDNVRAFTSWGGTLVNFYVSIGVPITRFNPAAFENVIYDGSAPGTFFVDHLSKYMDQIGLDYRAKTRMTSLFINDGGEIAGVVAESPGGEYVIKAKAVILATGSFTRNRDMVINYCNAEKYVDLPRVCSSANTGDGILAAVDSGANLVNMSADFLKLSPVAYQAENGATLSMHPISATSALVNDDGLRFANEFKTAQRDLVDIELEQPNKAVWAIFDQKLMDDNSFVRDCNSLGYIQTGTTWEELAAAIGMKEAAAENFVKTMEKWQATGVGNVEEDFGATIPDAYDQAPYHAIRIQPLMQGAYCGIETDDKAHVIDTEKQPIPHLYAAGVVSGHGCPPTSGLSLSSGFGRIAGQTVVAEIQ